MQRHGVDPARLDVLPATRGVREHLAAYGRMHVALDTFPYAGVTTTCEALWMGVPVATLSGEVHASRVGASLLSAAGFEQWVAQTENDFVSTATRLATDRHALIELRRTMRDRLRDSSLLDAGLMAAAIERAFRQMWREWCAGRSI